MTTMIRYVLISALFISGASFAQAPPSVLVAIPAQTSCGDWHAERRGEGMYRWQTDVSWFQGFVAGHNVYTSPPENRQILAEPNDVALWLDTYCQKPPTEYLVHAAAAYIEARGGTNPWPAKGVR